MLRDPRLLRRVGLSLTAVAVLYTVLWFWEAAVARRQLERFLTSEAAAGHPVTTRPLGVGGFPFAMVASLKDLDVADVPDLPGMRISAPVLTARMDPWNPGAWHVAAPLGVTITRSRGADPVDVAAQKATLDLVVDRHGLRAATLHTSNLRVEGGADQPSLAALDLTLGIPPKSAGERTGESARFQVEGRRLSFSRDLGPLGSTVDRVLLNGVVNGTMSHQRLAQAVAAWRDEGGTIELRSVRVDWGKLSLQGEGTLSLDRELQPLGAFNADIHNWPAILDALVAEGSITRKQAEFARLGLSLLAGSGPDGSQLKTPITLQNGQVYLEKAKIARLPQIEWPQS